MARDLTAGMATEVTAELLRPIVLIKLAFDGGELNLWNGIDDLSWSGDTYSGAGDLLGISAIEETQELRAVSASLQLSGVPASIISTALAEDYQGRSCKIWLAALDDTGAIVADPYLQFDGRMDVMRIEEGADTAIITVSIESRLIDLERPRNRRYTDEDQQAEHPGDRFFEFVPALQEKEVKWGP